MINILKKVKYLKNIEKICKISLYQLPIVSFAMNNNDNNGNNNNNINNIKENYYRQKYQKIFASINEDHKKNNEQTRIEYEKFLGKGGCGVVVLASISNANLKKCALKIVKNNESNKKTVYREVGLYKEIRSHIPDCYLYKELDDYLVIGLEYFSKGDLKSFMKEMGKQVLYETAICYIAGQIVKTLRFLHVNKHVAHLDIKQSNILVDGCLNFVLSDLSISAKYNEKYKQFMNIGTTYYQALELLERKEYSSEVDFYKPDIFALGSMCYNLFTGSFPYLKRSHNFIDQNGDYDYLKSMQNNKVDIKTLDAEQPSDMFKDFLLKCLEKDFTKRPNIVQIEKHPFIKSYEIISQYKENIGILESFYIAITTDCVPEYNEECKKYILKNGILTLKEDNVEKVNSEINNENLGEIIDNKFVKKEDKIKNVLKNNTKKIFKITKIKKK